MGMRVPALYFTLCVTFEQRCSLSFSRLSFCSLSLSCHCLVLLPSSTGSVLGHLGMCLRSLKLIDGKPAILYPKFLQQSPESWQPAYLLQPSEGSQCRDCLPAARQFCEHWLQLPAVLGCHKPLLFPEKASPPSWENSVTFFEVFGWMEWIKCYLPVPVQHGMPCLSLLSIISLF